MKYNGQKQKFNEQKNNKNMQDINNISPSTSSANSSSSHTPEHEIVTDVAITILETTNQASAPAKKKRNHKKKKAKPVENSSNLRFYPKETENYILSLSKTVPTSKNNSIFDILFAHGEELAGKLDKTLNCIGTSFEEDFCGFYFFFQSWSFHYQKDIHLPNTEIVLEINKLNSALFINLENQIENFSDFLPSPLYIKNILCCDFLSIDPKKAINETIVNSQKKREPKGNNEKINTTIKKRQNTAIKNENTQLLINQFGALLENIRTILFSRHFLIFDVLPAHMLLPPEVFVGEHPGKSIKGALKSLQLICAGHRSLTKHRFVTFTNHLLELLPPTEEALLQDPSAFYQKLLNVLAKFRDQKMVFESSLTHVKSGRFTKKQCEEELKLDIKSTSEKGYIDRLELSSLQNTVLFIHACSALEYLTCLLQIMIPLNILDAALKRLKIIQGNDLEKTQTFFWPLFANSKENRTLDCPHSEAFTLINSLFNAFDNHCNQPALSQFNKHSSDFLSLWIEKEEKNESSFLLQTITYLDEFYSAIEKPFTTLEKGLYQFKKIFKNQLKILKKNRDADTLNELKKIYQADYSPKLINFLLYGELLECAKATRISHLNEEREPAILALSNRLRNRLLYLVSLFLREEDFHCPPLAELLQVSDPISSAPVQNEVPKELPVPVRQKSSRPKSSGASVKKPVVTPLPKVQSTPEEERITLKRAIKIRQLTTLLGELGFSLDRMRGDHAIYMFGSKSVVVPGQPGDTLAPGTQKSIENRINEIVNEKNKS